MEPALLNEVPSLDLADFTSGDPEQKKNLSQILARHLPI